MIQRFSIGLRASEVYRLLDGFARPTITAALVLAVAVIGLLVTAGASTLAPSLSTVIESTWSQPPAVAPQGVNHDRGSQDDYLERLVEMLGHDS